MATCTTIKDKATGKVISYRFQIRRKGYRPVSKKFDTKAKGQRWAKKTESAMDSGNWQGTAHSARWTLGAVIGAYLKEVHPIKPFGKTKKNALLRIQKLPIADVRISDLTGQHFFEFAKHRRLTVKGKSVTDDIGYMSKALVFARAIKLIPNADKALKDVRPVLGDYDLTAASRDRDRRLVPGEFEALMSVPHTKYNGATRNDKHKTRLRMKYIIPIALETTMREAEIARMMLSDADLDAGELMIYKRKHPTKKDTNDQRIPLTEEAIKVLREYLALGIHTEGKPIFWPVSARNISDMFGTMCKVCGINEAGSSTRSNYQNLVFHDLRHEAITRLFAEGYVAEEVMLFSGHTDMKSLLRYVNLTPADVLRAKEIRRVIMEHRLDEVQFNSAISAADAVH